MLYVLLTAALLNLLLWAGLIRPWYRWQAPRPAAPAPPLSVVIAARNEAHHLTELLPQLLSLSYDGPFEVVLVLDRCTDDSVAIVRSLTAHNTRLRPVVIDATPEGWAPKKWALEQGIATAQHPHLVFTDADCRPDTGWLGGMGAAFAEGADLVLGLGPYTAHPGLLNAAIQYETFLTGMLYLGAAAWGRPYMGVGRNLGYTRTFFDAAGGFAAHRDRLSGDDDLLVNAAGPGARVALLLSGDARTESAPERSWGAWWRQKMRHLSAGTAYRKSTQLFLALFHGAHAIFYLSLLLVLWETQEMGWALGVWLSRNALLMVGLWRPFRKWNARNWVFFFPGLDVLYLLYNLLLVPLSLVSQPKWKG